MAPWTLRLILANIAVYLLTSLVPGVAQSLAFIPALALDRPWTFITYMFVHGGLGHIFFNMLSLFICGPRLEERLGSGRFLWLYLVSGVSGALLSFIHPATPIIGASGAVFGVMLGFARYWPREKFLIWGIIPVEARVLVFVLTAMDLFGATGLRADRIAHFAHLGGFVGGLLFLLWHERHSPAREFREVTRPAPQAIDRATLQRWNAIQAESLHEVNRSELERIRHKMTESGVGSLTPGDREFLDRFSPRY